MARNLIVMSCTIRAFYVKQDACSGVHTSRKNEDMRALSMM